MPYSIITRDGIQINNIPDDIPRDSDILKQRVEEARLQFEQPQQPEEQEGSGFFRRAIADSLVSLGQGVIGLKEAGVGLLDIPTLGRAGKVAEAVEGA